MSMRYRTALLGALLILAPLSIAHGRTYRVTAALEIRQSVGTQLYGIELLSVEATGTAEVNGGVVRIPAGVLSAVVPNLSGFGGGVVNGPATFSIGGAGPGATCNWSLMQAVCIDGGGFGGVMALSGITHQGQPLVVWGLGGTSLGWTASGLSRIENGTLWTQGDATAEYYIFELDPGTPFWLRGDGTFRGLPSTFTGSGPAGFSLVTPMVVTADSWESFDNARAMAKLRIDFGPRPVPVGGAAVLALLLALAGVTRLGLKHSARV